MTDELPRRGVLQGMGALGIGIGGGMGSPQQLAEAIDELLADAAASEQHDPHTEATFAALVDAVVPETPKLGAELEDGVTTPTHEGCKNTSEQSTDSEGDVHAAGGLAVDLHLGTIEFINNFISPEGAVPRVASTDGETAPLSESVAIVLDTAADELVARGGNHDTVKQRGFGGGSTFAMLSRCDRFRAMTDIEERGGKYGGFVVALAAAFPTLLYYSDWAGYDDFSNPPSERSFDPTGKDGDYFPGWAQTDYTGPTKGAAVLRGYEVEEFEETYETDEESTPGRDSPPGQGRNDPPDQGRNGGVSQERPTGHATHGGEQP